MGIAKEFFERLKEIGKSDLLVADFLEKNLHYHDELSFEDILNAYEKYFSELSGSDKEKLSDIFWEQVNFFGTPIIEDDLHDSSKCNVYFLFPKDKISDSKEKEWIKKDLYLQGDFHGYGSTDGRQRLSELPGTGIMWRKDEMPKEAIVVYKFIEVEPRYQGLKPEPQLPPFFTDAEGFVPRNTNNAIFPDIPHNVCIDKYSTHISPFPGFEWGEKIFRVSADSEHAHIQGKLIDWPDLLNTKTSSHSKFVYYATLYSDQAGDLHRSDAEVTTQYHDDLNNSDGYSLSLKSIASFDVLDTNSLGEKPYLLKDEETNKYKIWGYKEGTWQLTDVELTNTDMGNLKIPPKWEPNQTVFVSITNASFDTLKKGHTAYLPYADFTRSIQVFTPALGKIDNVIVINDGIPYLIAGILDYFDKMGIENTALVFVNILPGLRTTLSKEAAEAYDKDPSVILGGMGVRLVDYKHGIDQYADFIANKLFPQLKREISIPDDPDHRIMIGSSMSGTASIYIGSYPDLFGAVIAQSPSPDNREILSKRPRETLTGKNIYLSCGTFEHPDYAAANDNVGYATELSRKLELSIPFHTGDHGHQFVAWNAELADALYSLKIQSLMQAAYIPGISIATISQGKIQSTYQGYTDNQTKSKVDADTQFWACSLSKPVFAYLVLKLIKDGMLPENFLDEKLPWNEELHGSKGEKSLLTPRMLLSHQTGLPNEGPANFKFNPDEGFKYSGEGYVYLQKIIEEQTKKSLEELAQTKLFVPLQMKKSTFLFPEVKNKAKTHDEAMTANPLPKQHANDNNAAGSLHTTASDYARFLMACMNDKDFVDLITPQINSMEKDIDAKEKGLGAETLKPIDWGLGFGLQKNEDGKVIAAFHWGHGPGARTFFAINLEQPQSAVVYLTNSENGLSIAKDIVTPTVGDITPIMKFLSEKYDYENIHSSKWKEYHEYLTTGVKEEEKGNFDLAIELYKEAEKIWQLQYGGTARKNAELSHRIAIAEEANKKDNLDIKQIKRLVGEYGPLVISIVDESKLQINDGSPNSPRDLKWINNDTLLDVGGGRVMLKFKFDEGKNPVSLSCHFPGGANSSFPALKSKKSVESPSVSSQSIFSQSQVSSTTTEKEGVSKIWVKRLKGG